MWRTLCCLIGVLSTALLNSINALTNNRVTSRARPHCQISMLKDDGFKPKIITPNDIASLFGDNGRTVNNVVLDGYSEDDDDFDFDGDEEEPPAVEEVTVIPATVTKMNTDRSDAETNSMRELLALQKEMMAPPAPEESVVEINVPVTESSYASDESPEDVDDYLNFDKVLDKVNGQQSSRNEVRQLCETLFFTHMPSTCCGRAGHQETCHGQHDYDGVSLWYSEINAEGF